MSDTKPILAKLDRPRALVWGDLASYRLGTLSRPPEFSDLRNQRKCYSAMIGIIWAAISDGAEDFPGPEALIPFFGTSEAVADGVKAICAMVTRDLAVSQKKSSS